MLCGRIRYSGMKASPVTFRTRTSKASWVRSLPSPRWVLLQSLRPVKFQAGRGLYFRGAIRRFKKSPSTCSEVRPLSASDLILPSTESKSGGRDGLALQDPRSEAGPSVGMARRSLASVVAMTHSLRHSSHFPPWSPGMYGDCRSLLPLHQLEEVAEEDDAGPHP